MEWGKKYGREFMGVDKIVGPRGERLNAWSGKEDSAGDFRYDLAALIKKARELGVKMDIVSEWESAYNNAGAGEHILNGEYANGRIVEMLENESGEDLWSWANGTLSDVKY